MLPSCQRLSAAASRDQSTTPLILSPPLPAADFKIEIDILVTITARPERPESIVKMFEFFQHYGRWCIAFECLGPSL